MIDADAHTTLVARDGFLTVDEESALSGNVSANVPSLKTTGGLFGPSYLLDGHLALKLALGGTVAKPNPDRLRCSATSCPPRSSIRACS